MRTFYPQTCEYCHTEFQYTRTHPRKYCSHKCSVDAGRTGYKKKNGYVTTLVQGKPIQQHRLVMQQHIGRRLLTTEVVHHIDRNPSNNSIENLQLFAFIADHVKHHYLEDRGITDTHAICRSCGESKPHAEFFSSCRTSLGIKAWCKDCEKVRAKIYRLRRKEKLSANPASPVISPEIVKPD